MRKVSAQVEERITNPDKTGPRRPVVRATIQRAQLQRFSYDTADAPGGDLGPDKNGRGVFTSIIFGDDSSLAELRSIKTMKWDRSVEQDVASATLTLLNAERAPIGNAADDSPQDELDLPGWYTYNRGDETVYENPWGYTSDTGWNNLIAPDRLVKTYEGYGFDPDRVAGDDPNLLPSGTWLIDRVTYSSSGEISIEMRDVGALLLHQIVFPPVIPYDEYPLSFDKIQSIQVPSRDAKGGSWGVPNGESTSSNARYVGKGLTNEPFRHYVNDDGNFDGHRPRHALNEDASKYWQSTGQVREGAKVWWQYVLDNPKAVAAVRLRARGGPYRAYISVRINGEWVGKKKIPYDPERHSAGGVDNGAGIKYVRQVTVQRGSDMDVILKRAYGNVEAVRVTFSRLRDRSTGEYPFFAGLSRFELYTAAEKSDLRFERGTTLQPIGNYKDYTDIVKWVCAWAGFYWPDRSTGQDLVQFSRPEQTNPDFKSTTYIRYDRYDNVLPDGRVWGDFEKTGTAGVATLTPDLFDKQPLMDIINYVRDVVGFSFWIDETGAVIWRLPNIWKAGNYLSPNALEARNTRKRTNDYVTITEDDTLLDYSTTLSSENLRERVFVADNTGKTGVVVKGFVPYRTGFRRVAGWTDQNFKNTQETRVMADLIVARQMFDFRRGKATTVGDPRIQIDDQIRIYERVTNETFFHYVLGISSNLDMDAGTWTYDIDTHWLGERRSDAWVMDPNKLDQATQNYLNLVGVGD
jgi:hypothetical protein